MDYDLRMSTHTQTMVVIGVIEWGGRFLILRRVDDTPMWHHKWEFPGGKIEAQETPLEALHREVREESGLSIRNPELLGIFTHTWNLPERTQQTFLISYRAEAEADGVILCPKENDAYQWVTPEEFFALEEHLEGNKEMLSELYMPRCKRGADAHE